MDKEVQKALEARKKRMLRESVESDEQVSAALKYREKTIKSSLSDKTTDFQKRLEAEINTYNELVKKELSFGKKTYDNAVKATTTNRENLSSLKKEIEAYRKYLGNESTDEFISYIDKLSENYDSYLSAAKGYSQFDSEKDYNKFLSDQKDRDEKLNFNLETGRIDLEGMKAARDSALNVENARKEMEEALQSVIRNRGQNGANEKYNEAKQKYHALAEEHTQLYGNDDWISKYNEKESYINEASLLQTSNKITSGEIDYDTAMLGAEESNKKWQELQKQIETKDAAINSGRIGDPAVIKRLKEEKAQLVKEQEAYISNEKLASMRSTYSYAEYLGKGIAMNKEYSEWDAIEGNDIALDYWNTQFDEAQGIQTEINNMNDDYASSEGGGMYSASEIDDKYNELTDNYGFYNKELARMKPYMEDSQFQTYIYFYENFGKEKADEYLYTIEAEINQKEGEAIADKWDDNGFVRGLFGLAAGLNRWHEGVAEYIGMWGDSGHAYDPYSAMDTASSLVRESYGDSWWSAVGRAGYDIMNSIGNMTPSIVLGSTGIPVVSQVLSLASTYASSGGNAYKEMLRSGYTQKQARIYGKLVGASEAGLQYLLTGITQLGGGGVATNKLVENAVKGVNNAFAKVAIEVGVKSGAEFIEEGLQEYLDPWFKSIATGVDFGAANVGDVLYAGLLGALTAGAMEGAPSFVNLAVRNADIKSRLGGQQQEFVNDAMAMPENNSSHDLAVKYQKQLDSGKDLSGNQLTTLLETMNSEKTASDKTKIQKAVETRLTELGETENIPELAEVLTKEAAGEKLDIDDKRILANSKYGERVSNELNPENIISEEYSSAWAEEIGTEVVNPLTYNTEEIRVRYAVNSLKERTKASNVPDKEAENSPTATQTEQAVESSTKAENAPQRKISTSNDGKTTYNGEEVSVERVNRTKDGDVIVKLSNGQEASVYDVKFASKREALVYEAAAELGMSADMANDFIDGYRMTPQENGKPTIALDSYIYGFMDAHTYGQYSYPEVDLKKGTFTSELTKEQRKLAYNRGKIDGVTNGRKTETVNKKDILARNKRFSHKKGKVTFDKGVTMDNEMQEYQVKVLEAIAKTLGVNIHIYESTENKDGKRERENGYYDLATKTIYLDKYAGVEGNSVMLFTASHELTHFIRDFSEAKFKEFADFLFAEFGKMGQSVEDLVAAKIYQAKKHGLWEGKTESEIYDLAYEEVVADACERMLVDSKAVNKLINKFGGKNPSLLAKISEFIRKIIAKIKQIFANITPDSREARLVAQMKDTEALLNMWADALMDAGQNYQAWLNNNPETLESDAVRVDEDGNILLHMRQYKETGRETLEQYLIKQHGEADAKDLMSTIDKIYDVMAEIKQDETLSVFGNWQETEVELDDNGHPIFTTSIKNGDYELNQDFSRVCKKRRQLDFVLNMLAADPNFEASHLTKQDFVKINQAIKEHGFEIACALCFVDSKRFRQAEWADSFANTWNDILNAVVKDSSKLTPFNFATSNPNLADDGIEVDISKPVMYRKWSDGKEDVKNRRNYDSLEQLLSEDGNANVKTIATLIRDNPQLRHTFRGADIIGSQGFDTMQRLAPAIRNILDGWGGSSVPKPSSNDASYDSSIINLQSYNKEKAFAMGGARMNSFSDFMAHMFFDYCQAFADLSAKELPSQAYTKELDYVRFFGRSGQKQNMSGIPAIRANSLSLTGKVAETNKKIEQRWAGLDVSRVLEHLGKEAQDLTEADVEQFIDMCDYVWADESINMKYATLLQTGILYDKLSDSKVEECYELLKAGEIEQALKVAGEENVDREYAKHCGTIVVGVSDAHIRKLLRDPTIRMVIPYHKSGLNPVVARELRISAYNDYTDVQNTGAYLKGSKTRVKSFKADAIKGYGLKDFSFYDWFGQTIDGKLYDGKATADKYLEWCEKGYYDEKVGDYVYYTTKDEGYILAKDLHKKLTISPKFNAFMAEENYYKVLEDFDCYNTITGEHSPQEAVDFLRKGLPEDYKDVLMKALKKEQKISDDFQDHLDNKGLRDEIMGIVKKNGYEPSSAANTLKSVRDSEGNTLTESQAEFFKDSKVRDENGNLLVVYHGSPSKFTVFQHSKIGQHGNAHGRGFYFTEKESLASGFYKDGGQLLKGYLNLSKPMSEDKLTIKKADLVKLIKAICEQEAANLVLDGGYESVREALRDTFISNYVNTYEMSISDAYNKVANSVYYSSDNDVDIIAELYNAGSRGLVLNKAYEVLGFDGAIYTHPDGTHEFVAFVSNQFKNIDNKTPTANPDIRYSLRAVDPVQPTSNKWARTSTTEEVKSKFPKLWDVSADESEVRNPTQISGTVSSYRKIYEFLKKRGFNGTILDASSGLGYGTKAGIEEYGFEVDDIEPYPDKRYSPKYTDYSTLNKKYDVIISNAVLNVVPQDQRDALVVRMGELLKDGGMMFINVRGEDVSKASSAVAINEDLMEYYIAKTGSYQKGFEQSELVAYLEDALGSGYTVTPTTLLGNKTTVIVTKSESYSKNTDNRLLQARPTELKEEKEKVDKVLEKENAQLKEDNQYLKELVKLQRQITNGTKFTKTSVEASAARLIKYANAWGSKAELATILNKFYEYIASEEYLTWEGIVEKAQPVIEWLKVRKKQEGIDDTSREILKDIKSATIYLNEFQQQEVANIYDSYNNYRKRLMGSVTIVNQATYKGGTSLDSQWQEWSELYPWLFDADINSNEMPARLMEIVSNLRDAKSGAFEYDFSNEMVAQDLLTKVYESYWDVSTLHTVADNMQKKINELKGKHYAKLSEVRDFHNEKHDQLKKEYQEKLKKARETIANKNQTIKDIVRENAEKRHELIAKKNQRIEEIKKEAAERRNEIIKQKNEKIQEVLDHAAEMRKKAIERRNKTEFRHAIIARVEALDKLLQKPTKEKHIIQYLQKPVADFLYIIKSNEATGSAAKTEEAIAKINKQIAEEKDVDKIEALIEKRKWHQERGSNIGAKLEEIQSAYNKTLSDPENENIFQEEIYDKLGDYIVRIGDTPLAKMTLEQLDFVYKAITAVQHAVSKANYAFAQEQALKISTLGNQTMAELDALDKHKDYDKGEGASDIENFKTRNLTPYDLFDIIGSKTLSKLYDNVRKGEEVAATDSEEATIFARKTKKKYGYKSWNFKKSYKFTSNNGKTFTLNLEQIMSLYAYSRRAQADKHLGIGGIVFPAGTKVYVEENGKTVTRLTRRAETYPLSKETIDEIISNLNDDQKAFVEEMQEYLSKDLAAKGNEVSMAMYGIEIFGETNYFPLRSAALYNPKVEDQDKRAKQGGVKIKNKGMTKTTNPNANNPIIIEGFMDVWASHVNDMATYHGLTLPLEDFTRVYNYKYKPSEEDSENSRAEYVKEKIVNAYGQSAINYINRLLDDINGGIFSDPAAGIANKLITGFKKAKTFTSLSVFIQQFTSMGRSFAYIEPKYFYGKPVDKKTQKETYEEMQKYAPVTIIKKIGGIDANLGRGIVEYIKSDELEGWEKLNPVNWWKHRDEIFSAPAAWADKVTWMRIWNAAKRKVADTRKDLEVGSNEFLNEVGKVFTEAIVRTQVYDSTFAKSEFMRAKDTGTKMATAFLAEPTKTTGMVATGIKDIQRGDVKKGWAKIGSVAIATLMNAIFVSLPYAMRDDDDDETFLEKYIESLTGELIDGFNPLTYLPWVKDIWSLIQGFDIERTDMALWADFADSVKQLAGTLAKDTENMSEEELNEHIDKVTEDVWGILDSICALTGIPVGNVRRDINGAINLIETLVKDFGGRETTWGSILDTLEDAVKDSTPVWGWLPDEKKAKQLYDAIISGDEAYRKRIAETYDSESAYYTALRGEIKKRYFAQEVGKDTVLSHLVKYCGMDADEAYWKMKEWDYEHEYKTTEGYSKYNDFYSAVSSGKSLKAVINEYTSHGVTKQTLASQITSHYKPIYKAMTKSQRASLKGYLLNAYVLLGYDRTDKSKDIDKWLED